MYMKREKGLIYSFHTSMSLLQILALVVPQRLYSKDSHETIMYWVFHRGTMLTCDSCLELQRILSCFFPLFSFSILYLSLCLQLYAGLCLDFILKELPSSVCLYCKMCTPLVFPTILCWPVPLIRVVLLVVLSKLLFQAVMTWKRDIDSGLMSAFTKQF